MLVLTFTTAAKLYLFLNRRRDTIT